MVRISEKELIKILLKNARMSYSEIARKLKVSEAAVRKKIKQMENKGAIKGYRVIIEPKKAGFAFEALIGMDSEPEQYMEILKELSKRKEVISLCTASGDHAILAECLFETREEFENFLSWLTQLKGAKRVCPAVILERIK